MQTIFHGLSERVFLNSSPSNNVSSSGQRKLDLFPMEYKRRQNNINTHLCKFELFSDSMPDVIKIKRTIMILRLMKRNRRYFGTLEELIKDSLNSLGLNEILAEMFILLQYFSLVDQ